MNQLQTWAGFAAITLCVLLLPFLPALRTLLRNEAQLPGAEPEKTATQRIHSFRQVIELQFAKLLQLARENGVIQGANENGRPFIVLGFNDHLAEHVPPGSRRLRSLVLATGHLDIPGELICDREIFAEGRINLGHNAVVKSMLSLRDIAIGPRARITRWVHSDRRIDLAEGGSIRGWGSAGIEITLARRARFEHLCAPRIVFGRPSETPIRNNHADTVARFDPPMRQGELLGNGRNLSIPAGHTIKEDLIVSGVLRIGDGCRIFGELRADKGIVIGDSVSIEGAVFAEGPIHTGKACNIGGPLISSSSIKLGAGNQIGSPESLTTLAADTLLLSEGCIAHGTVRASRKGELISERNQT